MPARSGSLGLVAARRGPRAAKVDEADEESAVIATIAGMTESGRAMAERLRAVIKPVTYRLGPAPL